jgi:PAS domain S-box-containing protein
MAASNSVKMGNDLIHKILFNLAERCSNEVFWIRNPDYTEQIYVSPSFSKIWGRSIEQLAAAPHKWIETVHPDDRAHMADSITRRNAQIARDAQIVEHYRIICPDNTVKWIKDISYPIFDDDGSLLGFAGIAQDITADKLLEDEEKRQMTKLVNTMKIVASSIAHEIRTPLAGAKVGLTVLRNFIDQIIAELATSAEEGIDTGSTRLTEQAFIEQRQFINKMIHRIDMGTDLVNLQLKNMATERIDSRTFTTCSISQCIKEAVKTFPFESSELSGLIHLDLTHDFDFSGNSLLTKHVLWNLLKNALYFIREEDRGEIYIRLVTEDMVNKLIFTDTAKGIDRETLTHIFDRFYTQHPQGNGLGLSFCKVVMDAFGGDIICRSEEGRFAEFTLSFPKLTINNQSTSMGEPALAEGNNR